MRSKKKLTPEEVGHAEATLYLLSKGWWCSPEGWRHRQVGFPWPEADALRLQQEADKGGKSPIHFILRGEAVPAVP